MCTSLRPFARREKGTRSAIGTQSLRQRTGRRTRSCCKHLRCCAGTDSRMQLKHKRLDADYVKWLSNQYRVTLRLEVNDGKAHLICRDDGVGMTKGLISDYLLVSGESLNPDLVELQLECRKHGVEFMRCGQFGIGVLSYFMIADHAVFRTLRSQEAGSGDKRGWEFETWGIGSFGELRAANIHTHGTEAVLDIKPEAFAKYRESEGEPGRLGFYRELDRYIRELLVYVPCGFELLTSLAGVQWMKKGPGWARTEEERKEELLRTVEANIEGRQPSGLITAAARNVAEYQRQQVTNALARLRKHLDWIPPVVIDLPHNLGRCRISVPYCDDTKTLALVVVEDNARLWEAAALDVNVHVSFRGMDYPLRPTIKWEPGGYVQIDLTNSASVRMKADRSNIQFASQEHEREVFKTISKVVADLKLRFARDNSRALFSAFNFIYLGHPVPDETEPAWFVQEPDGNLHWRPLNFPYAYAPLIPRGRYSWSGKDCPDGRFMHSSKNSLPT